jgi:hypothetical protein
MKASTTLLLLLIGIFHFYPDYGYAQTSDRQQARIQPTIIVIPYTKQDEDIRTVMEADIGRRVAVAKVKEGFDNRGFTTVDFVAALKNIELNDVLTSPDQSSVKTAIIEASRADIFVEIEAFQETGSGEASRARIILTGYDAFTSRSLGTKTSTSVESKADFSSLVENALRRKDRDTQIDMVEDFLNVMQEKFDDIVENGRPIQVIFSISDNAVYDFYTETASGDRISDEIEFWLEENAYKGNYADLRITKQRVIADDVRIPLRLDNGRPYRPTQFAREIRKWFSRLDVPSAGEITVEETIRGGSLTISLQ